jgi:hypothetical protein
MVLEEQMIFISSQLNNMSSRHFDAARTPPTHKTHSRKTNTHTQGCHSPDTQANILMATNTLPLIHNPVFCTAHLQRQQFLCPRGFRHVFNQRGINNVEGLRSRRTWGLSLTHTRKQLRERRGCLARVGRRKERLHPAIC